MKENNNSRYIPEYIMLVAVAAIIAYTILGGLQ